MRKGAEAPLSQNRTSARSEFLATSDGETGQSEAQQSQGARLRNVAGGASGRSRIRAAEVHCRILHANRETVPVLIRTAAPRDRIERSQEPKRTMRFASTGIVAVELVLKITPAKIDDDLAGTAATPIAAIVAIDTTEAEQLKIPVEGITVDVEADERKYRVGDRLREVQGLRPPCTQGDDVVISRDVVHGRTGVWRRRRIPSGSIVLPIVDATARLIEADALRIRVGHSDG